MIHARASSVVNLRKFDLAFGERVDAVICRVCVCVCCVYVVKYARSASVRPIDDENWAAHKYSLFSLAVNRGGICCSITPERFMC